MNLFLKTSLMCLMFTAATGVSAAQLGRLFFSPEQRAQLELQQSDTDNSLTVNGIVQKQGGVRTVWVNGVPHPAGASDERAPESVPVEIPGQAKPVVVKVGQKIQFNPMN